MSDEISLSASNRLHHDLNCSARTESCAAASALYIYCATLERFSFVIGNFA